MPWDGPPPAICWLSPRPPRGLWQASLSCPGSFHLRLFRPIDLGHLLLEASRGFQE